MSITSKIFLDKRFTKKDGTQAIKLRLTINRKSIELTSGYTIDPRYWDDKNQKVKPKCPTVQNVTRLNNLLRKQESEAIDKLIQLQEEGALERLTKQEIKKLIKGEQNDTYFLMFCQTIINELEQTGKVGNARVYFTMRNSVRTFRKEKDIPLKQITYKWLKKYEAWYLGRGNSVNGLAINMRTLRALLNRAIKRKLLPKEDYPFEHYSIKKEVTRKRAISKADIDKIKAFEPQTVQQGRFKDYFLMSFYLMGTSFVDLAFLKVKAIRKGRIEYKRKKTGKLHSIKITPPLQSILDKYLSGKGREDYILDIINSTDTKQQYVNVRDEIRRYNRRLKEIAKLCGIESNLTSYVARHSFATIAKYKDVPIPVISQALGHSNLETTEVYLAEFDNETMDRYNAEIIGED
ncbi:MAG: site-specific integrase [Bacteroidota bacterium]